MAHHTSLISSILSLLLIILSFSFAIASTASRFWAISPNYSDDNDPVLTGYQSRSPFYLCSSDSDGKKWNCTHTTKPGGICNINGGRDTPILCQQLRISGQLLIASCVLVGVAFLVSAGLTLVSFIRRNSNSAILNYGTTFLFLLTASGATCMGIAQLLGTLGLLVLQFPNGESATSTGDQTDILSTWTGRSGMSFAAASWIMGAFAAFFVLNGLSLSK